MRILLVNDYASPSGGAEMLLLSLRDELRRRGHDVRVFASSAAPHGHASQAEYTAWGTLSRWQTFAQTANPSAAWRLRRALAEFRPEVVHAGLLLTQLSPLVLPQLRRVPSLYYGMWYRSVCPLGTKLLPNGELCSKTAGPVCCREGCIPLRSYVPQMLELSLWRRWRSVFRRTVANSESVARLLRAQGAPIDEVILPGVPQRDERPPLSNPPTAAFVGRFVREKGVDVLLRAFTQVIAEVPDARLDLVGDGPERARLEKLAEELRIGHNVTWLGQLPRAEMERALNPAWLQVIPSLWAEPFGLVALDAMMRGTAVVASNHGGLSESVCDGETGVLVPPGNVAALAHALTRVLSDRDQAETLGRAGRVRALKEFTLENCTDRFLAAYGRLQEEV